MSAKYGNRGWYVLPTSSLPWISDIISQGRASCSSPPFFFPLPFLGTAPGTAASRDLPTMYTRSSFGSLIFRYVNPGFTQSAKFEGRVHGVVVQASKDALSASPSMGKLTMTAGSLTSL